VEIYVETNTCQTAWADTVFGGSKSTFSLSNNVGALSKKKKKKSTKKKCTDTGKTVFEDSAEGGMKTIEFAYTAEQEAPVYISVTKSIFSNPTGTIDYAVSSTVIDVANATRECNDYSCEFTGLSGHDRTASVVVVNMFSETMEGAYEMEIGYLPDKQKVVAGSIAVGVITGFFLIITLIDFYIPML